MIESSFELNLEQLLLDPDIKKLSRKLKKKDHKKCFVLFNQTYLNNNLYTFSFLQKVLNLFL